MATHWWIVLGILAFLSPTIIDNLHILFAPATTYRDELGRFILGTTVSPKSARNVPGWRVSPAMYRYAFSQEGYKKYMMGEYIGQGIWYDPAISWKNLPPEEQRFLGEIRVKMARKTMTRMV